MELIQPKTVDEWDVYNRGYDSGYSDAMKDKKVKQHVENIKEKRKELYEDDNVILEQRGNTYYISYYNNNGEFQRECVIRFKEDGKCTMSNGK